LIALLVVPAFQLLSSALLPAYAGDASLSAADNTLILTSAALVLLMTPGLAFFYGGFVQARNVLNTMAMSFVMMGIATLVWVSFGFSLAFSDGGALNAVIGNPFSSPCWRTSLTFGLAWRYLASASLSFRACSRSSLRL